MEGRMTLCNMAIEMGAKVGMVAPDEVTFEYVKGRLFAPKGAEWDEAVAYWKTLATDEDAQFDKEVVLDAAALEPQVTLGHEPWSGRRPHGLRPNARKLRQSCRTPKCRSGARLY